MKPTIRTIIWSLIGVALVGAGYYAFVPKAVEVETAEVVEGRLRVSVREDGMTRIREKYVISAPVSGRLSRIQLHAGDPIAGDHSLIAVILPSEPAILDARSRAEANARVQASEASLKRVNANAEQFRINHDLAKIKFDRSTKLLSERAISQDEFDTAKAEYMAASQAVKTAAFETDVAQFELEMAKAASKQFGSSEGVETANAETGLTSSEATEPFEIVAPVSGKVLRVFQESSTVVTVGTPLIEVGDPRNLEIEIDVLSTDATRIRPGTDITIEHWGGNEPLRGHVRVIEPAAFTKVSSLGVEEQRVNIIADFDETSDRIATLGDGYRVEARITIEELENVLLVPNSSLFRFERKWHVLTVADGKASMTPVTLGMQNDSQTQIVAGLKPNDIVILYPGDNVETGTPVKIASSHTSSGGSE